MKLSSLASYFLAGAFLTTGVYVGIIAALVLGPIFNWIIFFIYKETDSAYAYKRILLRQVGGGYIFIHRLLLDYFASLNT